MAGPFSHLCLNQPEVLSLAAAKGSYGPINEWTTHMAPSGQNEAASWVGS